MIDATVVYSAVDQERIRRPSHRDVAINLHDRLLQPRLQLFWARLDARDEVRPARMMKDRGAVRPFHGDGGLPVRTQYGQDRRAVMSGNPAQEGIDGSQYGRGLSIRIGSWTGGRRVSRDCKHAEKAPDEAFHGRHCP